MIRRQIAVTSFGSLLLIFAYQATACGRPQGDDRTHARADHITITRDIVSRSLCLPIFATVP